MAMIELAGKLGVPYTGGASGIIKGAPLQQQVDEIVRVYTERYFPLCEKYKVRMLWEPYAGGPNIATGPMFEGYGDPLACLASYRYTADYERAMVAFPRSGLRVDGLEGLLHGPGGKQLSGRNEHRKTKISSTIRTTTRATSRAASASRTSF
jgi:hypothetical protein